MNNKAHFASETILRSTEGLIMVPIMKRHDSKQNLLEIDEFTVSNLIHPKSRESEQRRIHPETML